MARLSNSSSGRRKRVSYDKPEDNSYVGAHSVNSSRINDNTSFDQAEGGRHSVENTTLSDEASAYSRNSKGRYTARSGASSGGKSPLKTVLIVLVALLAIAGIAAGAWFAHISGTLAGNKDITLTETETEGEPYYVLLLGGDSRQDTKEDNRTDSIMVARIDEANKKVSIVSVPRDLRVNIEGHGMQKINSAIEFGGYDAVIKEVNEVLDIKINYYAFIYFSGFKDLVDALGGVTVAVPEGTYYNGVWVPSGDAVEIDGREALTLARCRHGNPPDQGAYAMGDYQRTMNQRNLIKAIAKKILKQDPSKYPSLIGGLAKCIETNMSVNKIVDVATAMKGFNTDDIDTMQLPVCGDTIGGGWYAAMYEDVFQVVRSNFVNGDKLNKGIDGFAMENNDNDLTSSCVDGEKYAYTSYADHYGSFK